MRLPVTAATALAKAKRLLTSAEPDGLLVKLAAATQKLSEIQSKLDAPDRAFQAYLKELSEWQDKRTKLEGNESDPDSLKGLQAALAMLADLPAKVAEKKSAQIETSQRGHV